MLYRDGGSPLRHTVERFDLVEPFTFDEPLLEIEARGRRIAGGTASMRFASSQESPPIGWPAAKSSSVGASVSSMIAAFSGPWGMMRRAVALASGSWALLASHCWRPASVSCVGGAMLGCCGAASAALGWDFGAGLSQLRGISWTATSTPASSHQANALRASAMPINSASPPTEAILARH